MFLCLTLDNINLGRWKSRLLKTGCGRSCCSTWQDDVQSQVPSLDFRRWNRHWITIDLMACGWAVPELAGYYLLMEISRETWEHQFWWDWDVNARLFIYILFLVLLTFRPSCSYHQSLDEIRYDQSDSHRHRFLHVIAVVNLIALMGTFDHDLTSPLETYG